MNTYTMVYPGKKYPLGAVWTEHGVNFAVYSERASKMTLCIFDEEGRETQQIDMRWNDEGVWHCFLPQARPGLIYGYRADGLFDPKRGFYFNSKKLLLDPYAKSVVGAIKPDDAIYGYEKHGENADGFQQTVLHGSVSLNTDLLRPDSRDSAPYVYKAKVIDDNYSWEGDIHPDIPLNDTVIYEMHVKGFSKLNPAIPADLRGTYAGLADPASIDYLKKLGVTAVELLPIHLSMDEIRLSRMKLSNYWGYNTLGFFCPDPRFAATADPVNEFKDMVRALHRAGLEVILDVVYNHTAEQGNDGPTLSFRGLDNITYYRLNRSNPHEYHNFTGCGNSLDTRNSRTLQLIADSLRYWVDKMHVDGFRFDLASTLARTGSKNNYHTYSGFFNVVAQDPILSKVKLIAEPWDCGPNGYQVGAFPKGWSEWNGDYRDAIKKFWRGDKQMLGKAASKISGSSDLYWNRSPLASINYITAHDGFTLNDSVTYQNKLNYDNGEGNRDGTNDNYNWNCGVEGPSTDTEVKALRFRQMRNMLLTLFVSQGVPMLLGGDEIARTQRGNNNAYCQDNQISYFDWNLNDDQRELLEFTRQIIKMRKYHPIFRRKTFFNGQSGQGLNKDVTWISIKGKEMSEPDWNSPLLCFGMYMAGNRIEETDLKGERIMDDSFLVLFNNESLPASFELPNYRGSNQWEIITDTCMNSENRLKNGCYMLAPHSTVILRERAKAE